VSSNTHESVKTDLLVIGGGMAGLAAAGRAAEAGAAVTVVEKASSPGGSAALSAGILWTAPDFATLRTVVPGGDPELGRALVDGYEPAVDWVRSMGVSVTDFWTGQMGFGTACRIDIHALIAALRNRIEQERGEILLDAQARRLTIDRHGHIRGAEVAGPDGLLIYEADSVLLATGGFQGDPELRANLIGPGADTMLLRSNPYSTGDGFRLGMSAGAAPSHCMEAFYGHLVPSPLDDLRPEDFLPLTQYYSNHAIIVNRLGHRFVDESLGDEVSNQATLRQPGSRALILFDHRVRTRYAASAPYPHGQVVDRVAGAQEAGGRVAEVAEVDELIDAVAQWGVPATVLRKTLDAYTAAAKGGQIALEAPLPARPAPLVEPPFYAVEVQPSITFPFGGLAVDADGRALDRDGRPIAGMFAAGADAGGLQDRRYVGGLALGLVFGRRAAAAALGLGSSKEVSARG
jgi:succinate dehydrogenase/fumarate reductase flavoprotein subunit